MEAQPATWRKRGVQALRRLQVTKAKCSKAARETRLVRFCPTAYSLQVTRGSWDAGGAQTGCSVPAACRGAGWEGTAVSPWWISKVGSRC